jgi:hypothetical protein
MMIFRWSDGIEINDYVFEQEFLCHRTKINWRYPAGHPGHRPCPHFLKNASEVGPGFRWGVDLSRKRSTFLGTILFYLISQKLFYPELAF